MSDKTIKIPLILFTCVISLFACKSHATMAVMPGSGQQGYGQQQYGQQGYGLGGNLGGSPPNSWETAANPIAQAYPGMGGNYGYSPGMGGNMGYPGMGGAYDSPMGGNPQSAYLYISSMTNGVLVGLSLAQLSHYRDLIVQGLSMNNNYNNPNYNNMMAQDLSINNNMMAQGPSSGTNLEGMKRELLRIQYAMDPTLKQKLLYDPGGTTVPDNVTDQKEVQQLTTMIEDWTSGRTYDQITRSGALSPTQAEGFFDKIRDEIGILAIAKRNPSIPPLLKSKIDLVKARMLMAKASLFDSVLNWLRKNVTKVVDSVIKQETNPSEIRSSTFRSSSSGGSSYSSGSSSSLSSSSSHPSSTYIGASSSHPSTYAGTSSSSTGLSSSYRSVRSAAVDINKGYLNTLRAELVGLIKDLQNSPHQDLLSGVSSMIATLEDGKRFLDEILHIIENPSTAKNKYAAPSQAQKNARAVYDKLSSLGDSELLKSYSSPDLMQRDIDKLQTTLENPKNGVLSGIKRSSIEAQSNRLAKAMAILVYNDLAKDVNALTTKRDIDTGTKLKRFIASTPKRSTRDDTESKVNGLVNVASNLSDESDFGSKEVTVDDAEAMVRKALKWLIEHKDESVINGQRKRVKKVKELYDSLQDRTQSQLASNGRIASYIKLLEQYIVYGLRVPPVDDDGAGEDLVKISDEGGLPSEPEVQELIGRLKAAQADAVTIRLAKTPISELKKDVESDPVSYVHEFNVLSQVAKGTAVGGRHSADALKLYKIIKRIFDSFAE